MGYELPYNPFDEQDKNKIVIQGTLEFETEDGGAAKIAHLEGPSYDSPENGMFVKINSWDDRAWDEQEKENSHPLVKEWEGKRVRITIEIID